MPLAPSEALVSTAWLADHLDAPDVRVVDGTYFMPASGRDGRAEFESAHIPGAVYFDIDEIAAPGAPKPHTVPAPELFSARVRDLGLGDGLKIVVYDQSGGAAAACRVWWMFRLFGHQDVAVLDGGLGKWRSEGRPLADLPRTPGRRHFTARLNNTLIRDRDGVRAAIGGGSGELIVDARVAARFKGEAEEPWPGARKGHVPDSVNLPYGDLLTGPDGTFAQPEEIRAKLRAAGIDLNRPLISTCGSGVTACVLALACHLLGKDDVAIYDGSWHEWSTLDDTYPVVR